MASSGTDHDDASLWEVDGDSWISLRCSIDERRKELLSAFLFGLGSRGLTEEHAGLDLGDDGPLLSGDDGEWRPSAPASPTGRVDLVAWFRGDEDAESLVARTAARLAELGAGPTDVTIERVASQDWNAAWKERFEAFQVSPRLWIAPTWRPEPPTRAGERVIRMDPGMAFGTGTHFTTAGCLRMLDALLAERPVACVLDVGTGTGVLAIGALLLGAERAIGIDVSTEAVAATVENAARNGVGARLTAHKGALRTLAPGRFPVVVANLLAPLLVDLAAALEGRLDDGGRLIVSGLLRAQEPQVIAAMGAARLALVDGLRDDDWAVLAFAR